MCGSMCLLIFIGLSATMLHGRQKKSCNFTEILKALNIMSLPIDNIFFHNFVQLGFAIAEYNDWPTIETKIGSGGG